MFYIIANCGQEHVVLPEVSGCRAPPAWRRRRRTRSRGRCPRRRRRSRPIPANRRTAAGCARRPRKRSARHWVECLAGSPAGSKRTRSNSVFCGQPEPTIAVAVIRIWELRTWPSTGQWWTRPSTGTTRTPAPADPEPRSLFSVHPCSLPTCDWRRRRTGRRGGISGWSSCPLLHQRHIIIGFSQIRLGFIF